MVTKDKHKLLKWVISQILVLCAVIIVYLISLKQQMVVGFGATSTSNYLANGYWDGSIKSLLNFIISGTQGIIDFSFPGIMFLFSVTVGFFAALGDRRNRTIVMMFLLPMVLTLLAAIAKLYPYMGFRQVIFLTPMIYVLFGLGLEYLFSSQKKWVVYTLIVFVACAGIKPLTTRLNALGTENLRPVVSALSTSFQEGDKIYVYYGAKPAFTYYYRDNLESQVYGKFNRNNTEEYFAEMEELLSTGNRFWLVFSHCHKDECQIIPTYLAEKRTIELVVSDIDALLYLVH